jgi:hypothetical protein
MTNVYKWILGGMLALGVIGTGTLLHAAPKNGDDKAEKPAPKPAAPKLAGRIGALAVAANLNDEQKTALAAKIKAMGEELKKFDASKAEALKTAKEQSDAVAKERKELAEKLQKDVMSAFTADHIVQVDAAELAARSLGKYRSANVTEEQTKKAQESALAATKQMAAITADDKEANAKKAAIAKQLDADIAALMTPEQKQAMVANDVIRDAMKGAKGVRMTADVEKAVAPAAAEAAKKIADLEDQKAKVLADLRAKIEAEAAKAPAAAPKANKGKAKDGE